MQKKTVHLIDHTTAPKLSSELVLCKGKAAAICLEDMGKKSGIALKISGARIDETLCLEWNGLSEKDYNSYSDAQEATEWGAECIAFIVINHFTEYEVFRRSHKGTGFDYLLSKKGSTLFQDVGAKLEVSGIKNLERGSDLTYRVKQKIDQASRSRKELPLYVVVVAFSVPKAEVSHVEGC